MRLSFDDGTLLLEDSPDTVPHAEWDNRVDEYRAPAQYYQEICEWATGDGQATLQESTATVTEFEDTARSYSEFDLTPSVAIEPRDYQQEALAAWRDNDRRGSVVLPTGSGKTFLAVQAIADAVVELITKGVGEGGVPLIHQVNRRDDNKRTDTGVSDSLDGEEDLTAASWEERHSHVGRYAATLPGRPVGSLVVR